MGQHPLGAPFHLGEAIGPQYVRQPGGRKCRDQPLKCASFCRSQQSTLARVAPFDENRVVHLSTRTRESVAVIDQSELVGWTQPEVPPVAVLLPDQAVEQGRGCELVRGRLGLQLGSFVAGAAVGKRTPIPSEVSHDGCGYELIPWRSE